MMDEPKMEVRGRSIHSTGTLEETRAALQRSIHKVNRRSSGYCRSHSNLIFLFSHRPVVSLSLVLLPTERLRHKLSDPIVTVSTLFSSTIEKAGSEDFIVAKGARGLVMRDPH